MYQDAIFGHKTMGDVDVVYHDGVYHLFHLVLPNHDFVAHAVSRDGLNWERAINALFIGHPGSWDDHMLWTVHVCRDPWNENRWRMFYTGLARKDQGRIQRIGCAYSEDLEHWEKASDRWLDVSAREGRFYSKLLDGPYDVNSAFPLEAAPPHYESSLDEGRKWISFRDPYFFQEDGVRRLLVAARTASGPVIRRGCVAVFEETAENEFELQPPLHHPGQYDDIEVPNVFRLGGRYYLVGSIREDAKIRYWYADEIGGPWSNYFDNVLLPAGNYAARISFDDKGPLVWNFFSSEEDRTIKNLMPPPKRLRVLDDGRLTLQPFEAFDELVESSQELTELLPIERLLGRDGTNAGIDKSSGTLTLTSRAGFEAFLLAPKVESFRLSAKLQLDGPGKCGLVFRIDPETSSGYFLSLDLMKGVAQLRAWGENPGGVTENAYRFEPLQAAFWQSCSEGPWRLMVTGLRNYLEIAVDNRVLLTLSDDTYCDGRIGFYVESACLKIDNVLLEQMQSPKMPTDTLPGGE